MQASENKVGCWIICAESQNIYNEKYCTAAAVYANTTTFDLFLQSNHALDHTSGTSWITKINDHEPPVKISVDRRVVNNMTEVASDLAIAMAVSVDTSYTPMNWFAVFERFRIAGTSYVEDVLVVERGSTIQRGGVIDALLLLVYLVMVTVWVTRIRERVGYDIADAAYQSCPDRGENASEYNGNKEYRTHVVVVQAEGRAKKGRVCIKLLQPQMHDKNDMSEFA
jgi:hypothetical protein